jgi:hypothetical protein
MSRRGKKNDGIVRVGWEVEGGEVLLEDVAPGIGRREPLILVSKMSTPVTDTRPGRAPGRSGCRNRSLVEDLGAYREAGGGGEQPY